MSAFSRLAGIAPTGITRIARIRIDSTIFAISLFFNLIFPPNGVDMMSGNSVFLFCAIVESEYLKALARLPRRKERATKKQQELTHREVLHKLQVRL